MVNQEKISDILIDVLDGTNLFPVDVRVTADNKITIEIDSDDCISIDDCMSISKKIEPLLDRDSCDFELEVGSSGLTSPFKVLRQYKKYEGKEVEVLTKDGRKLSGILKSSHETGFVLCVVKMIKPEKAKKKIPVEEEFLLEFDQIKYTKYLLRFK